MAIDDRTNKGAIEDAARVGKAGSVDQAGSWPGSTQDDIRSLISKPSVKESALDVSAGLEAGFEDGPVTLEKQGGFNEAGPYAGKGAALFTPSASMAAAAHAKGTQGLQSGYEDTIVHMLSGLPFVNHATFDQNGRNHFLPGGGVVWHADFYDRTGEPWGTPTSYTTFTGYGADGKHYTNGVLDAGPVIAPWSSEVASQYRSPRSDFPVRSLICFCQNAGLGGSTSKGEVVIFDLDSFDGVTNSTLQVWMRFEMGDSSNFRLLGRLHNTPRHLQMVNGTLVLSTLHNGLENGGLFLIDFKRDGEQDGGHLIRSDNHWYLAAGKDLTNRNDDGSGLWTSTGPSPSLRIDDEQVYRVAVVAGGVHDLWVAETGEDYVRTLKVTDNVPQWVTNQAVGDGVGTADLNDYWYRNVLFDEDGWLWTTVDNRLYRNLDYYKDGQTQVYQYLTKWAHNTSLPAKLNPYVELPSQIFWVAYARGFIYCGTKDGIYKVDRGSLDFWLAYTVAGKGGQGRNKGGATGAVLAGRNNRINKMWGFDVDLTSYLCVATTWDGNFVEGSPGLAGGGVTLLRLKDDVAIVSHVYSELSEDGAYTMAPAFWKA